MLHINEVFHSNILYLYVLTPILVIIFSLRNETHGRHISITIDIRKLIIVQRTLQPLWEFPILSPYIAAILIIRNLRFECTN
jgi:hypothetical protein